MKGDGRFYLACALMLLALPGCTHGISAAVPLEDSYAMAEPNDVLSPGERGFREVTADEGGRHFIGARLCHLWAGRRINF